MRKAEPTDAFKVLSVSNRMQIFTLLKREGPLPVKEIAESLGMTAPTVSQHLRILRTAGFVNSKRQGYWVPYAVDASALSDCCGMSARIFARPSCGGEAKHGSTDRIDSLLNRGEQLLSGLQRVETELEALREQSSTPQADIRAGVRFHAAPSVYHSV